MLSCPTTSTTVPTIPTIPTFPGTPQPTAEVIRNVSAQEAPLRIVVMVVKDTNIYVAGNYTTPAKVSGYEVQRIPLP